MILCAFAGEGAGRKGAPRRGGGSSCPDEGGNGLASSLLCS